MLRMLTAALSGFCNAALLAVTNAALRQDSRVRGMTLMRAFVALCVSLPFARFISELLFLD